MTNTLPTPYPDLNLVLQDMVQSIQTILGEKCAGAYLQGSFAVGDFDVHSDVDFIVAIAEDLVEGEVAALRAMSERLFDQYIPWGQHLEGSYFPLDVLRDYRQSGGLVWYFDHGHTTPIRSNHCNTALVRWVVRAWGVTLAGPEPASLVDPVPVRALRREILDVIHNWGRELLVDPEPYRNRFYQGFIVLNYCRMLHDLRQGFPGSKRAGAEWAKTHLDPSWAGLIDRAWDCRPDPATSVRTRPDPADFQATLDFVQTIMQEAAQYAAENDLE